MNLLELRQTIEEALAGLLGTYTDADGEETPAVWVGGQAPSQFTAKGVEVIIDITPQNQHERLGSGEHVVEEQRRVRLIQHEPNRGLHEETLRLMLVLPIDRDPVTLAETDNTFEQVTFSVRTITAYKTMEE